MEPQVENKVEESNLNTPVENILPQESKAEQEQETQEKINWKRFRESKDLERRKREEAEKRAEEKQAEANALKAAMESLLNRPTQHSQPLYEEEETEDQRIQKKIDETLAKHRVVEEDSRQRKELAEFPQRLATMFNDFDQICNTENLDYLEYHYPEVAAAYKNQPDGFDKWSNIYKAVKRFVPNTNSKKDQSKAENNFSKPKALSTPGLTQTGDTAPMQLDDKKRASNWARMQKVMKNGS